MRIIPYKASDHAKIMRECVALLRAGKIIAHPTDTAYGLACDATNVQALRRLYLIKGRPGRKPTHVIVPSIASAKKLARWNSLAGQLAHRWWPGPLTLVLPLKSRAAWAHVLASDTGTIGLRDPDSRIARDLARGLKKPVTTPSANVAGKETPYSAEEVIKQFRLRKHKPDVILDDGRLPKRKASTVVRISGNKAEVIRKGPVKISLNTRESIN